LAKRLSSEQKKEILKFFILGKSIEELSQEFSFTKLTISRNLKKNLGEKKYKELITRKNKAYDNDSNFIKKNYIEKKNDIPIEDPFENFEDQFSQAQFVEIAPLDYQIDNTVQKELASVPVSEFEFPKVVYMIVDKKVEIEIKYLRDYPRWEFLSKEELDRKTIEIFLDLKIAKGFCGKEQKVIKVPNTNVFKIVAPILLSRGVSRIVSSDRLIAL
tara:strand:- start:1054 stop:1701 length:648 start_codon:yes stop_codon:yes gene_type:complete